MTVVYVIKISDGFVSWYHHGEAYQYEEIALERVQYLYEYYYPADLYSIEVEAWELL